VRIVLDVLTERESSRHPATREMHEDYLRFKIQMANDSRTRAGRAGAAVCGSADILP